MANFESVDAPTWRDTVLEAVADGFDFLVHLTAVDDIGHSDSIRVLAWLEAGDGQRRYLATSVARNGGTLPSVADELPAAAWLERHVREFFGVTFDGGDDRPLLNHHGGAPLLKDFLLEPRTATRWPGALEPGESDASPSRRRITPPGVPDAQLPDDATADEIALSAAGIRVRRRR